MNRNILASSPTPASPVAGGNYLCVTDLYEQQLRRGELIAAHCTECSQMTFPPEANCQYCQSVHVRPFRLSGRGRLCSADIASCPDDLSVGDILLEEGVELRALLVGDFQDPETLTAYLDDKPVEVRPSVLYTHGLSILAFEPITG